MLRYTVNFKNVRRPVRLCVCVRAWVSVWAFACVQQSSRAYSFFFIEIYLYA